MKEELVGSVSEDDRYEDEQLINVVYRQGHVFKRFKEKDN